jgi:peptide/nickel transport system permease protein
MGWPALGGATLLLFLGAAVLGSGRLTPFDPLEQDLSARLTPPGGRGADGRAHVLGTDPLGRDVLARLVDGTRYTFAIAGLAMAGGTILGTALGVLSGYRGGWTDLVVMRFVELQMALPFVFTAMLVVALYGPGFGRIVGILVAAGWVVYVKLARATTLTLREREFVVASRAIGGGGGRIMFRHILPNLLPTVVAVSAIQVGRLVVAHAALEFLGLGLPPPQPTWGGMLSDGRSYLASAWWVTTAPGAAITVLVVAITLTGEGLRNRLLGRSA